MRKKEFESFKKMLDSVTEDIAKDKKYIAVAHGGGVDSTAVLCSFTKTNIIPYALHVRSNENSSWEFKFGDCMVEHISKLTNTPLIVVPFEKFHDKVGFYDTFPVHGIHEVVTGEGMDRCYGQWDPNHMVTMGMDFRAHHPLFDMMFMTVPTRFRNYRAITYEDSIKNGIIGKERKNIIEISKQFGLNVIMVSSHPIFEKFFAKYQENVRDIFFPKQPTFEYVKDFFGRSFNSIVREVYKRNRYKFDSFGCRLLKHW